MNKDMLRGQFPKVLIVSRGVWDDNGTSNTLTNIFSNYPPEQLAQIYIETKKPNTQHCKSFFQISEYSLIKKLSRWDTKTGQRVDAHYVDDKGVAEKEASTMDYVREHRRYIYTILREFLWLLNGWKSKELKQFIIDENPDVIWLSGSPLILMNRLGGFVAKTVGKPYCVFEMDDVYSYKHSGGNLVKYIYRFFLRKNVKKLVNGASQLFVISPKMKKEYDAIFGTDSIVLTKGIDFSSVSHHPYAAHQPVQMVYMGKIIYDRFSSLELIGRALDEINQDVKHIILNIYTNNSIEGIRKEKLIKNGNIVFHAPVPYSEVKGVIENNDVVLFVESLNDKFKDTARLSFSTKITDYLASGKCIFAVGPDDIAPMEYFKENDAALVAHGYDEIRTKLMELLKPGMIEAYSQKAFSCGMTNHDKAILDDIVYGKLIEIANNK